jgi:hypothetical protein
MNMRKTVHIESQTKKPGLAARLCLRALSPAFIIFWAGLLWLLGQTLSQLIPAALNLDPAALLLWLTLGPMTIHLAQAPFHRPRKPSGPPVFLRPLLFEGPLVFLPLAGPGRLETGPAFFAAATPGDRALIMSEAEASLAQGGRSGRLSLLLECRNPLDLALRIMSRGPWLLAVPAWLFLLLTSPTRQLTRLWGFLFFKAGQAWADPGPPGDLTIYKRQLAWDIWLRAQTLGPPPEGEDEAAAIRRLDRMRASLARIHQAPDYGAQIGEPWPETEADIFDGPKKIWLNPGYRGVFLDLPVTLYASSPDRLPALGRPEKNLGAFYPPELTLEVEAASFLAAEREFLASLLADQAENSLIWLDGRFRPTWSLWAEMSGLEARYDKILKRISAHHGRSRAAHLAAAESLGRDWPNALQDWGDALWLAEHGRENLAGAGEIFQKSAANPKPSAARAAAENFYTVWADLKWRLAGLGRPLTADLTPPAESNCSEWESTWREAWRGLDQTLVELRDEALTGLLTAEEQVAAGAPTGPAPSAPWTLITADFPALPDKPQPPRVYYPSSRFKAGPASSTLAALILSLLIWQGHSQGLSQVTIYNGLPTDITVAVSSRTVTVPSLGHRSLKLKPGVEYEFIASLGGQTLEKFRQRLAPGPAKEIYNVARAAPLMEWWFPRSDQPGGSYEFFMGRPHWLVTRATVLFEKPSGDRRVLVLSGYGDADPAEMLAPFPDPAERAELARLHARHISPDDPRFRAWLDLMTFEERGALLRERLLPDPLGADLFETQAGPPLTAPELLLKLMETGEAPPLAE